MILKILEKNIREAISNLGLEEVPFVVEHPAELSHGDYACNAALILGKRMGKNPKEVATNIVEELSKNLPKEVEKIEIAGAGFINVHLSRDFFTNSIKEILEKGEQFGKNETYQGKVVLVEHSDPNPFKEFHIGHLMPNVIGSTIARLFRAAGADVKELCYQGDVGLHVAKSLWGILKNPPDEMVSLKERVGYLGKMYAVGARAYEENEQAKKEIQEINKKVFEGNDQKINALYDAGRRWSLEYFETIYQKLGTKFDHYFFESETGVIGKKIVEENLERGVFQKSDGAVVFKGEEYGLHTRVFINSEGLPTYEAKELGLAFKKSELYPHEISVAVTGNEINDYFKVILAALGKIDSLVASKIRHVSHGMLRLPTGKMSSRTGDVVTFEELLSDVAEKVDEKIKNDEFKEMERRKVREQVAIAAIKFAILRQSIGRDIIFDFEKSLSFEGDSGPYLQYTHTRARSVLEKAKKEGKSGDFKNIPNDITEAERLLYRFPMIVARSVKELDPHYIVSYLIELAGSFNTFYAATKILDESKESAYRVALTEALSQVLKNGLTILGIPTPEKM